MAKRSEIKEQQEKFIAEFKSLRSAGNVLVACQTLGYARSTVYHWRIIDEGFAHLWDETVLDGFDIRADEAENALRLAITKDRNITAIIFTLKNLRPDRYRERFDVEYKGKIANELKQNFLATLSRLGKNADEQLRRKKI